MRQLNTHEPSASTYPLEIRQHFCCSSKWQAITGLPVWCVFQASCGTLSEPRENDNLRTQPKIQKTPSCKTITNKRRNIVTKNILHCLNWSARSVSSTATYRDRELGCFGTLAHRFLLLMRYGKLTTYIGLRDIAEIVNPDNPLQTEAANGTEMPYVGWVEITLRLVGSAAEFQVSILIMKGNRQPRPIIGFNVNKHFVINSQTKEGTVEDEKLIKTKALPNLQEKNGQSIH